MGAIQNAINSAAGAAAKVTTAIAGIDALKTSEKAKGLQEKVDIQKDVAEDLNDLNAITTEADKAAKAQETAEQNLKNSEDAYKRGFFGTPEATAE